MGPQAATVRSSNLSRANANQIGGPRSERRHQRSQGSRPSASSQRCPRDQRHQSAQGPHWRREWETPGFDELIGAGAAWKRAAIACPEGPQNSAEPVVRVEPLPSKGRFRVLRRGPSARRLRIRTTCAAYHRPPLGDGTFRALSAAATASAGSSANPSRIGRNRSARSFSADRNL